MRLNNYKQAMRSLLAIAALLAPFTASAYDFMENGLAYNFNAENASVSVTYANSEGLAYQDLTTPVVIPSEVTHEGVTYPVTAIGEFAFSWCTELPAVTIPESVTVIGMNAFYCCYALEEIYIPKGVTFIDEDAFSWDRNLNTIVVDPDNNTYDSRDNCNAIIETSTNSLIAGSNTTVIPSTVKDIAYFAFSGRSFTEFTISEGVETIGEEAFEGCKRLKSVKLPNTLKSIAFWGFGNCIALESIDFGTSLETIGEGCFYNCSALNEAVLPNSLKTIGSTAFAKAGLQGLALGTGITTMAKDAFIYCESLKEVITPITEPTAEMIGYATFYAKNRENRTLYVPKGTKSTYEALEDWVIYFSDVVELSNKAGDVNNDSETNTGDVSAIYGAILGTDTHFLTRYLGDTNGDGVVNTGDVSAEYSRILNQ